MTRESVKLTAKAFVDIGTLGVLVLVGMYIQALRSDINAQAHAIDAHTRDIEEINSSRQINRAAFTNTLQSIDRRLSRIEGKLGINGSSN